MQPSEANTCLPGDALTRAGKDAALAKDLRDLDEPEPCEEHMLAPCDWKVPSGEEHQTDDELDPSLQSGLLFVRDSDSEVECSDGEKPEAGAKRGRATAVELRPEYIEIKNLGLAVRPENCSLGIHPGAQVWRSYGGGSSHYGRSFGKESGRNAKQALLRVIELMLQGHLALHPKDRLAKSQLQRVQTARAKEPLHKD